MSLSRNLQEVSVVSHSHEASVAVLEPDAEPVQPIANIHTYRPTRWPLVNQILDIVDSKTHGRAGQFQSFFSFVFIGGIASLINLAVGAAVLAITMPGVPDTVHKVIAFLCASEISLIANFIPNDYFTFRHLPGHQRSWGVRCLRYHMASASGILLTFLVSFGLQALHIPYTPAQAIAIMIVLFYNFAVHHLFTYRQVKVAAN